MSLQGKTNAWIKPSGQFIEVGYMEHNEFASNYFREKYGNKCYEVIEGFEEKYNVQYPYEILHELGWVRLMTWTEGLSRVYGGCEPNDGRLDTMDPTLNHKQKETLQDWCMDNNYKYDNLFSK